MMLFGCSALKCNSMNNQKYRVRPEILNINSHEPSLDPNSILVNKCSCSCNNINGPYAKSCLLMLLKTWILNYLI